MGEESGFEQQTGRPSPQFPPQTSIPYMNLNNFLLGCQPWESRNNLHFSPHRPLMRDPYLKSWNPFMLITLLQVEDGRDRDILIIAPLPPRLQHYCSESLGPQSPSN